MLLYECRSNITCDLLHEHGLLDASSYSFFFPSQNVISLQGVTITCYWLTVQLFLSSTPFFQFHLMLQVGISMYMLDSMEENTCVDVLFSFPLRCFFFGDVSSKRDPTAYLNAIFSLCDYYQTEYCLLNKSKNPTKTELPLVINTPGWVKGSLFFCWFAMW